MMSTNRSDMLRRWLRFEPVIMLCLGIIIGLQASIMLGNTKVFGEEDMNCPCSGSSASSESSSSEISESSASSESSDSSSSASVVSETNCHDEVDNDADSLVDCEDSVDCTSSPYCSENCTNNIDDDNDDFVDCADLSCVNEPVCTGSSSSGS